MAEDKLMTLDEIINRWEFILKCSNETREMGYNDERIWIMKNEFIETIKHLKRIRDDYEVNARERAT